jgi:hypothetical protein
MRYTKDVTGGKPIAIWSQSISAVSFINPLVAFYNIHGRKREALFFYFVSDTTQDSNNKYQKDKFLIFFHKFSFLLAVYRAPATLLIRSVSSIQPTCPKCYSQNHVFYILVGLILYIRRKTIGAITRINVWDMNQCHMHGMYTIILPEWCLEEKPCVLSKSNKRINDYTNWNTNIVVNFTFFW